MYDFIIGGLEATIHVPVQARGTIILLHGLMGRKDAPYRTGFAQTLENHNYTAVRFNFSAGSMKNVAHNDIITKQIKDLDKIIEYCIHKFNGQIGIMGACTGANVALLKAADPKYHHQIKSIVALAPYDIPKDTRINTDIQMMYINPKNIDDEYNQYLKKVEEVLTDTRRARIFKKIGLSINSEAIEDFKNYRLTEKVSQIPEDTATLFIIGDKDPLVSSELVQPLVDAKKGIKNYKIIKSRSHGYINPREAEVVNTLALNWFDTTLN